MKNYKLHVHSFIRDYKNRLTNSIDHIDYSPFSMSQESIKIPNTNFLNINSNKSIPRSLSFVDLNENKSNVNINTNQIVQSENYVNKKKLSQSIELTNDKMINHYHFENKNIKSECENNSLESNTNPDKKNTKTKEYTKV